MSPKVHYIPDGYHSVTPYLYIDGAAAAIDFYKKAFGATEVVRMPSPNGRIGHAEIRIGDSAIMLADEHPEMGYRSCLGIIRLGQRYPAARVEAAAERALASGAVSYKSIDSILRHSLDQQPLTTPAPSQPRPAHDNVRGAEYFQ